MGLYYEVRLVRVKGWFYWGKFRSYFVVNRYYERRFGLTRGMMPCRLGNESRELSQCQAMHSFTKSTDGDPLVFFKHVWMDKISPFFSVFSSSVSNLLLLSVSLSFRQRTAPNKSSHLLLQLYIHRRSLQILLSEFAHVSDHTVCVCECVSAAYERNYE